MRDLHLRHDCPFSSRPQTTRMIPAASWTETRPNRALTLACLADDAVLRELVRGFAGTEPRGTPRKACNLQLPYSDPMEPPNQSAQAIFIWSKGEPQRLTRGVVSHDRRNSKPGKQSSVLAEKLHQPLPMTRFPNSPSEPVPGRFPAPQSPQVTKRGHGAS